MFPSNYNPSPRQTMCHREPEDIPCRHIQLQHSRACYVHIPFYVWGNSPHEPFFFFDLVSPTKMAHGSFRLFIPGHSALGMDSGMFRFDVEVSLGKEGIGGEWE